MINILLKKNIVLILFAVTMVFGFTCRKRQESAQREPQSRIISAQGYWRMQIYSVDGKTIIREYKDYVTSEMWQGWIRIKWGQNNYSYTNNQGIVIEEFILYKRKDVVKTKDKKEESFSSGAKFGNSTKF